MGLSRITRDLVVAGDHVRHFHRFGRSGERSCRAGELLDDVEVRIGAPLADLMADNGNGEVPQRVLVVGSEPAPCAAATSDVEPGGIGKGRAGKRGRLARCGRADESRAGRAPCAVTIEAAGVRVVPFLVPEWELLLIVACGLIGGVE